VVSGLASPLNRGGCHAAQVDPARNRSRGATAPYGSLAPDALSWRRRPEKPGVEPGMEIIDGHPKRCWLCAYRFTGTVLPAGGRYADWKHSVSSIGQLSFG